MYRILTSTEFPIWGFLFRDVLSLLGGLHGDRARRPADGVRGLAAPLRRVAAGDIGSGARADPRARRSAASQIEYETRIVDRLAAETRRRHSCMPQKTIDLDQQATHSQISRISDSFLICSGSRSISYLSRKNPIGMLRIWRKAIPGPFSIG